jgi:hypothetical protein
MNSGRLVPETAARESHSLPDTELVHIATTQNRHSFIPHLQSNDEALGVE